MMSLLRYSDDIAIWITDVVSLRTQSLSFKLHLTKYPEITEHPHCGLVLLKTKENILDETNQSQCGRPPSHIDVLIISLLSK